MRMVSSSQLDSSSEESNGILRLYVCIYCTSSPICILYDYVFKLHVKNSLILALNILLFLLLYHLVMTFAIFSEFLAAFSKTFDGGMITCENC